MGSAQTRQGLGPWNPEATFINYRFIYSFSMDKM